MSMKKLVFRLEQDADGYPPVAAESVWVDEPTPGQFVVENIPFFATQATLGDVVEGVVEDGQLVHSKTIHHSGNSLIRVAYYKGTEPQDVRERLQQLGCSTELDGAHSLIAVNVPPEVNLEEVQRFLQEGAVQDRWGYEEPLLMQRRKT